MCIPIMAIFRVSWTLFILRLTYFQAEKKNSINIKKRGTSCQRFFQKTDIVSFTVNLNWKDVIWSCIHRKNRLGTWLRSMTKKRRKLFSITALKRARLGSYSEQRRRLRSKSWWLTGCRASHYLSRFAAFVIDTRA